jgi:hypothetical protein
MYSQIDSSANGAIMGGSGAMDKRADLRQNLLSVNSHSLHGSGNSSDHLPLDVERGAVPANGAPAGDVDPFFVFKDDLLIKIKRTEDSLSHYVTLVHDTVRYFVSTTLIFLFKFPQAELYGDSIRISMLL